MQSRPSEPNGKSGIPNSDQVCQFTSETYKDALKDLRIVQSMAGKFWRVDNIMIDRWFRGLKVAGLYVNECTSPRMLHKAITAYIQQKIIPHESLDYNIRQQFPIPSVSLESLSLAG